MRSTGCVALSLNPSVVAGPRYRKEFWLRLWGCTTMYHIVPKGKICVPPSFKSYSAILVVGLCRIRSSPTTLRSTECHYIDQLRAVQVLKPLHTKPDPDRTRDGFFSFVMFEVVWNLSHQSWTGATRRGLGAGRTGDTKWRTKTNRMTPRKLKSNKPLGL